MKKRAIILTVFCAGILFSAGNITAYAKQPFIQYSADVGIEPYSASYEWRYKDEDGKLYRRLYDKTNQRWVGGWELCP